ncbi:MAG TPA: xanthine dehydrogenase family protein molybdopterin-binding subunit, partial [Trebonia sp.]|nr:xanthine dehydrogenase family protein molybdopterin-binding subunit [Trebonia sp.]
MSALQERRAIGSSLPRLDGPAKVTGTARYAFEQPVDDPLYVHPVQATIARGRLTAIDTSAAEAIRGVVGVLTHINAPRLAPTKDTNAVLFRISALAELESATTDRELAILQSDEIAFRGQLIGAVIAETAEVARHAAGVMRVEYAKQEHDAEFGADRDDLYAPDRVNPALPTDTSQGDVEAALASAAVTVDQTYTTPAEHCQPMEPHSTIALWDDTGLVLYDSTQSVHTVRAILAPMFGLGLDRLRVISHHVGGGFGAKGLPHAHNVLAALAAKTVPGRPVKLALTRQQMFSLVGYRTPTIQRMRLGAQADGRLTAIALDVIEQTSKIKEFAESTGTPTRIMYAAPNRRTTHRLAALDVPVPSWMRAPGRCPGMFGPEVAMDELAVACGLDPVQLRIVNEPERDPESGRPWSNRNLVGCLREGARRFGWERRDPTPTSRRRNGWLIGTGVASGTYPGSTLPGSRAKVRFGRDRRYLVQIGAADIGTGTWTALTQIAADALRCPVEAVQLEIGDSALPTATVAGGSSGISSWGSAIVAAARAFRERHGTNPAEGDEVETEAPDHPDAGRFAVHSFGAQFAEVHVHAETGEIRVPRMLGVFS